MTTQPPPTTTNRATELLELFLQVQGRSQVAIIRVPPTATVAAIIAAAIEQGVLPPGAHEMQVSLVDHDEPLAKDAMVGEAGLQHHHHVHCHTCHRVAVNVRYNGQARHREFSPATRFSRIHAWATGAHGFNLSPIDAAEHVLQVTATGAQPAPTDHLESVVTAHCAVELDLVAKHRIEG